MPICVLLRPGLAANVPQVWLLGWTARLDYSSGMQQLSKIPGLAAIRGLKVELPKDIVPQLLEGSAKDRSMMHRKSCVPHDF